MPIRHALCALLTLCVLAGAARAQTQAPAPPARAATHAAPTVTVSLTSSGVRLAALGNVKQTRLEVYDAAGAPVFDSGFRAGNVRDWAAEGHGLSDGAYTFVLTARDMAGRLSLKQGEVVLAGGQLSLALGGAEAAGGAEPRQETTEATTGGEGGAATLATHDGGAGALTSTAGDLTLRTGDILQGKDEERVRVTADGKVGVGTSKPEAALDVAGEVRARDGFRFADGSRLAVDEKGALARTSATGERLPAFGAAVAAAIPNRLAKFADPSGTLTDSAVFESGGFVGVGTSAPEGTLHIETPATTVFKVVTSGSAATGRAVFQMYRGAAASANGWDFGYNTDLGSEAFVIRELTNGSPVARVTIQKGSGNFGIGAAARYQIGGAHALSAPGTNNLFAGAGAGNVNAGTDNTFIGRSAGAVNSSGSFNTFVGSFAGSSATTGNRNTVVGYNARAGQTGSDDNAVFGYQAGTSSAAHIQTSIFGSQAGNAGGGADNSYFGYRAGNSPDTALVTGNSFFGSKTGTSNKGLGNSFFGSSAGDANTTGDFNSFFGRSAGDSNATGAGNVIIGAFADVGAGNLVNAVAIGHRALVTQSSSIVLGSISGENDAGEDTKVGVGTTAPAERLHVGKGNIYVGSAGQGVILKSPDGMVCRRLTIDNSGTLVVGSVTCP